MEMIAVGRISRSVGIRGEVKVELLTDDPDRFATLETIWIGPTDVAAREVVLESARSARTGVVMKLKGVETRTEADATRGCFLFIPASQARAPSEGSFFVHDIVGLEVTTEEGRRVGVVTEVLELPANDIWVVETGGREVLIPAIRDVIRTVDLGRKTVVIRAMEGLLE